MKVVKEALNEFDFHVSPLTSDMVGLGTELSNFTLPLLAFAQLHIHASTYITYLQWTRMYYMFAYHSLFFWMLQVQSPPFFPLCFPILLSFSHSVDPLSTLVTPSKPVHSPSFLMLGSYSRACGACKKNLGQFLSHKPTERAGQAAPIKNASLRMAIGPRQRG